MLVLSRKIGEQLIIQTPMGEVRVTLVDICHMNQARLGIDAPREWTIHRMELMPPEPPERPSRG